ncbi:DUF2268 domain-containing protein [Aquibacillus saliphilus]|uniref:DUF2268 domain-containing protein n=1 Tax=Aquibacillus saliphilus TaxID=1909422 RepID=UPI001CF06A08|nr:DUF2268 domain-containing protein [Aquibacillus saliphilus]
MSVVRTDKWLLDFYDKPIEICEKLKVYFDDVQAAEIYDFLILHGMYLPLENGYEQVKELKKNKVWQIVADEKKRLQKLWEGPTIPIFIFPSDVSNQKIVRDYNGKAGLAFRDKLFLFVSEGNEEMEIRSLFTHEYNHVCRLTKFNKKEKDYKLLDTVILEGLAENAVRERYSEESVASWTLYYSNEKLKRIWDNLVYPNRNMLKTDIRHQDILFGLRYYPKMIGYCVGYYLVKEYMDANELSSKELLDVPTDEIAQIKKTPD